MSAPLLALRGAGASFHGASALSGVDLAIAPGEIVTVVGPNGAGKSTLIRLAIGALKPSAGKVERRAGLRIGYVPQKLHAEAAMPLTVDRFLKLGASAGRAERARMLEHVGAGGLAGRQLSALSGGQLQRALLARALLRKPDLLVLDEPTQGLDAPGAARFYALIEQVQREEGCAVLLVSHDLSVVMRASDRVVCLNGHVCCEGKPQAVLDSAEWKALFGASEAQALAFYQHRHDHDHDHVHDHDGACDHNHDHSHDHAHAAQGGGAAA
ncbi:ATP-binding cassette domain-containing protein [Rhodovulum sp. DZ06]|uniref:ATP-binding cassette domain-containing protein n=1 Tax=Rhodovulum sp. DZ06 TaxID=3425126 RepID=UPI003D351854